MTNNTKKEVIELCSQLLELNIEDKPDYLWRPILIELRNKAYNLISNIDDDKSIQKIEISKKFDERDDHICSPFCSYLD